MKRALMACLILALFGSLALAVEPPSPPSHGRTRQQHEWLRTHLDADMGTINTFPKDAFDEMHRMVARTTRDEADLLGDYYQLSRKIAEREVRQIIQAQIAQAQVIQAQAAQGQGVQAQAVQPPAAPQEDDQAKADREELRKLSKTLAEARKPASTVGEYIYASLPGWCARQGAHFVPPSFCDGDKYVGPLDSEEPAGRHAGNVYRACMNWRKLAIEHERNVTPGWPQTPRPDRREPGAVPHNGNRPGGGFNGRGERSLSRAR